MLSRLLTFPNVLAASHQTFLTNEALTAIAEATVDSILRFLGDREQVPERILV